MKSFLFLLLFSLTFPAFAGNVVLLSSVKVNKFVYLRMESAFKKAFKHSGRHLIIHRETTPEILHRTLSDQETEILIWVSHAGGIKNSVAGMAAKGTIQDFYGNDVKNFFTSTTKNLKFLGIVGCSARSIIENFKDRGHYNERPDLSFKTYSGPVPLMTGLKETLEEALPHLDKVIQTSSTSDHGPVVTIHTRLLEDQNNSSWIEIGDHVYILAEHLEIPEEEWIRLKNRNIKHFRDLSMEGPPKIELTSEMGNWVLFATKEGRPIGDNNTHLYVYRK